MGHHVNRPAGLAPPIEERPGAGCAIGERASAAHPEDAQAKSAFDHGTGRNSGAVYRGSPPVSAEINWVKRGSGAIFFR